MAKDETEEGITGQPIPKKKMSPKKRHEFEKKRRAARKERGDARVGDTFSQHRMTGSRGHGSEYKNPVREEVLVDYLLDEGFASDEKSASAIASAMSEEWKQNIVEAEGDVNPSVGGKPMMVGGKPLSLDKKQFKWTQNMSKLRRDDPKKYKEVQSLMTPHGWKQPPAGMKVPYWL